MSGRPGCRLQFLGAGDMQACRAPEWSWDLYNARAMWLNSFRRLVRTVSDIAKFRKSNDKTDWLIDWVSGWLILIAVMELVEERYRPGLGTAVQIAFSFGFMMQPTIAYFQRDEFWYQLTATSGDFLLPFLIMYAFIYSLLCLEKHNCRTTKCCAYISSYLCKILVGCRAYAHQQWCRVRFSTPVCAILTECKFYTDVCVKSQFSTWGCRKCWFFSKIDPHFVGVARPWPKL